MFPIAAETIDYLSLLVEAVALLVTAGGLAFVVRSLRQTAEQQRIESGPYVRVDLGSLDLAMADFAVPDVAYRNRSQMSDLRGDEPDSVVISAWFRNVQVHPLGSAYGVYARFLIEMSGHSIGLFEVTTSIPYLQHGKNVQIDLLGCMTSDDIVVSLGELSFFDLYDRRHSHVAGEQGTNAQLGRLRAVLRDGSLVAVAEGRPRGPKIRYDG